MADCLPFDSIAHDRVYKASDWAWFFATFLSNGVFPKPSDGMQVTAYEGMEVMANVGYALINGHGYRNPKKRIIRLNTANGMSDRIDRIVIRWDLPLRDVYLDVLEGVPSAKPKAPDITRNTEIWELATTDIYVGKGVTQIRAKDITDLRFNNSLCGIVKGTIDEIDASVLTKQFEDYTKWYAEEKTAEFEKWVENIKQTLTSVENGDLLIELNEILKEMQREATETDIDRIIAGTYIDEIENGDLMEIGTNEDIDAIINGTYIDDEETREEGE